MHNWFDNLQFNIIRTSRKTIALELGPSTFVVRVPKGMSHYSYLPENKILDEMLAILSERNAIMQKKDAEQAQAKINEIYRFGLDIE